MMRSPVQPNKISLAYTQSAERHVTLDMVTPLEPIGRKESSAESLAEKQELEVMVASQNPQIRQYETNLDNERKRRKLLTAKVSRHKAECQQLVPEVEKPGQKPSQRIRDPYRLNGIKESSEGFLARKQGLEEMVASQKQQIQRYEADIHYERQRCKVLQGSLSRQIAECQQLVAEIEKLQQERKCNQDLSRLNGLLRKRLAEEKQQHIEEHLISSERITDLEKQLAEERLCTQKSGEKIVRLKKQLKEEEEKLLCVICLDKQRDTLILPCLHFHFCFACLMQHTRANSNTCPTCRGSIQGLCMSSFLT